MTRRGRVYADFNATTPLCEAAKHAMKIAMETLGNPSSQHAEGQRARALLDDARETVAKNVGVSSRQVVFTSGGSEGNGLALLGLYFSNPNLRILTTEIEHSSVRDLLVQLSKKGVVVHTIPIDKDGNFSWEAFERELGSFHPHLVSVMTANNETGMLFQVSEIAKRCRERQIPFHTDAVQAYGKVHAELFRNADLISISAHKIHGPKGTGALILREGIDLSPTHFGGSQEMKRRGGTENLIGIYAMAGAVSELSVEKNAQLMQAARDAFEREATKIPDVEVIGSKATRLPNTTSLRITDVPSDVLLSALDLDGIAVSAGSACSSGSIRPAAVLLSLGYSEKEAKESIRVSWGRTSTIDEASVVARTIASHVERIRNRRMRSSA